MNKFKTILAVLSLSILMVGASSLLPVETQPQPANAATSDKYDGDCTGLETVGRCSDKCPSGSYEIGRNADGSAICHLEPTGCPYGDAIPLDSPKCAPSPEEIAGQQAQAAAQAATPAPTTTPSSECWGK